MDPCLSIPHTTASPDKRQVLKRIIFILRSYANHFLLGFLFPPEFEDEPEAAASGSRSSGYGGNDYVDYGAYTGGYGAFGWYTDHPVGNSYNSGY